MRVTDNFNLGELTNREICTLMDFTDAILESLEATNDELFDGINSESSEMRAYSRGERAVYDCLIEDFGFIFDGLYNEIIKRYQRK